MLSCSNPNNPGTNSRTNRIFSKQKESLSQKGFSGPAPQHALYRDEFNAVDLFDKQYYKCTAPYPTHHWRTKMFFSLHEVFMINSFTLYREVLGLNQPVRLRSYREFIGKRLLIFNEEDYNVYNV